MVTESLADLMTEKRVDDRGDGAEIVLVDCMCEFCLLDAVASQVRIAVHQSRIMDIAYR